MRSLWKLDWICLEGETGLTDPFFREKSSAPLCDATCGAKPLHDLTQPNRTEPETVLEECRLKECMVEKLLGAADQGQQ